MEAHVDEMLALIRDLTAAHGELQAHHMATRLAVHSLIATHPRPADLHADMLDRMDKLADSLRPERIPAYRDSIDKLLKTIPLQP